MNRFYVYAYLRADFASPYYIGKGCGRRKTIKRHRDGAKGVHPPRDANRIVMIRENLSEEDAFALEKLLILFYGRVDNGDGILHNHSDGGEGSSGHKKTEECKRKISEGSKRAWTPERREAARKRMLGNTLGVRNKHTEKKTSIY